MPIATSEIAFFQAGTTHFTQDDDLGFTARAPPMTATNVAVTGGVTVIRGSAFALDGQEAVVALFGFVGDHNATNSVTRPTGIPESWISKPTNKGGGTRYTNPENPHDFARVMPGNPNSPNPAQQGPYVIRSQNGRIVDVNGNPVSSSDPAAHIPLSDFEF